MKTKNVFLVFGIIISFIFLFSINVTADLPGYNWVSCGYGGCAAGLGENHATCPEDCYCGNEWCDIDENHATCPEDCPILSSCGNGVCAWWLGEHSQNCPNDCFCGDGVCTNIYESKYICPEDCPICGDGVVGVGEECDEGNQNSNTLPDACREYCVLHHCGDGVTDTGEECDDGLANSDVVTNGCRSDCTLPVCGDGVVDNQYGEYCDEGENNGATENSCRRNCMYPSTAQCGDGVWDYNEECDNGSNNNNAIPNRCRTNCMLPVCGDGIVDDQYGEYCEPGENTANSVSCRNDCKYFAKPNVSVPDNIQSTNIGSGDTSTAGTGLTGSVQTGANTLKPNLGGISKCQRITNSGTYYLSDDIENISGSDLITDNTNHGKYCIDIAASGVVFDCKGHKIDGLGGYIISDIWAYAGVHIRERHNIELKNCIITDWEYGVHIMNSNNTKIHNNKINSNDVIGLRLMYTGSSKIYDNEIKYNSEGVGNGAGLAVISSIGGNLIHNNMITFNGARGFYHSRDTGINDSSQHHISSDALIDVGIDENTVFQVVGLSDSLNNNIICESGDKDLYTYPAWNGITGDNNKCGTIYKDWNDTGTIGCTYDCSQIKQMAPNIPAIDNIDKIKEVGVSQPPSPPPPQPTTTPISGTPPVKECPDNCKCLTKAEAEAEREGLYLCNNKYIICGYMATEALTAAAPNAIGVPKYCFGEKTYAKCQDNCECINRGEAYKKGYELCDGVVRECGADLYCFQEPDVKICGKDTLTVTRTINPKIVSPPAYVDVYLSVKPIKTLNGIIITEKIPKGMEPAWDYAVVSFDPDVEDKIMKTEIVSEVIKTIEANWTSRRPDSWDPDTREAKWVLRDEDGIKPQTVMYKLKAVGAASSNQIMYGFKGDWLISSGETCPIIGEYTVEIKPGGGWPPCPISDLELLKYIDMWAAGELTDIQMLRAIKIWVIAPPCPITITGAGINNIQTNKKKYKYENLVYGFRNCLKSTTEDIGEVSEGDGGLVKIDDDIAWSKCKNSYAAVLGDDFVSKLEGCLKENGKEGKVAIDDDPTWSKCKSEYAGTTFTQLSPQPDPPGMGLSDPDPPP